MSAPGLDKAKAAAVATAAVCLAACNPFSSFAPTHEEVRAAGWLFPTPEASPILAQTDPGFCYETLAEVDCYTEPIPELRERLAADPPILSVPPPFQR